MIVSVGLAPLGMPAGPRIRPVEPRSAPRRHPRATRLARGAAELLLWGALAAGIGMGGTYFRRREQGIAAGIAKAHKDADAKVQAKDAEMTTLRAEAATRAASAASAAAERESRIDTARKEAQHALALEQAATRRLRSERDAALARAADAARVRDEALARAATGGIAEGDDTVGACRARADGLRRALGEVLGGAGELLRSREACSLDLEDASGSARALLRWSAAVEASERAEPVAP